jgi:3-oxoacyl-[acyl-carrier protein] reductase
MDLELSGKVMLVTGGVKGIGAAMVQAFAVEGGKVAVIDRDQESRSRFGRITRSGGSVHCSRSL